MVEHARQLKSGDEILVTFLLDLAVFPGIVTRVHKDSLGARIKSEGDEFDVLIIKKNDRWELSGQWVVLHAVAREGEEPVALPTERKTCADRRAEGERFVRKTGESRERASRFDIGGSRLNAKNTTGRR